MIRIIISYFPQLVTIKKSLEPAVCELRGFLNCIGVESEKGIVFGLNAESEGEINHNENALNQAFEFGKNI